MWTEFLAGIGVLVILLILMVILLTFFQEFFSYLKDRRSNYMLGLSNIDRDNIISCMRNHAEYHNAPDFADYADYLECKINYVVLHERINGRKNEVITTNNNPVYTRNSDGADPNASSPI